MANRSDYTSILPRRLKRMLSLMSTGDVKQDNVVRKMFIDAHDHAKKVRGMRLQSKTNVDVSTEESDTNREARATE